MTQYNKSSLNIDFNKIIKSVVILGILILFVVTVVVNTLIIQEDEIVIIKEFGIIKKIITTPGLYFKTPILQSSTVISKRLMQYDSQPLKLITKDNKYLIVDNFAVWRINNASEFVKTVQTLGGAELKIDNTLYSVALTEFGKLSYNQIIAESQTDDNYSSRITAEVKKQLAQYGIDIIDVRLKQTNIAPENTDAVYSRMKADREKIASQHIAEGENEATQIKAEADKQVKITLSKAHADADTMKGTADAEAAKIYSQSYNQDPEFYKFIRTLESYKKTLKGKTTIVLPIDSPYTKYLIGK